MKWLPRLLPAVLLLGAGLLPAQDFRPPPGKAPDEATRKAIAEKTARLGEEIQALRKKGLAEPLLADLEIYHRAAVALVKHNEFFQRESAKWTLEALDRGLKRAEQAGEQDFPWLKTWGRTALRGYHSRIDGSVQPFAVTYPEGYDNGKKWRVDVVLHGRDPRLNEVKFLQLHHDRPAPKGQAFVRLDVFGRGNNAYRWAGEADIGEVVEQFLMTERALRRRQNIDAQRWVLRGFSMGGAGTWQLGLHRPSGWCLLGPGAGFTTTHGYVKGLPDKLPPYQEKCLTIYDAVDYAENVFNVPVVAYGGEKDSQLQAARNIEKRLAAMQLPVKVRVLVAPGLGHKFPAEWQEKAEEAYAPHVKKGREEHPRRVRFVTYTLKYPECSWVRVLALKQHYERALVDATRTNAGFRVRTTNVRALRLVVPADATLEAAVEIDGQKLKARPWGPRGGTAAVFLQRKGGRWEATLPQRLITDRARRPQKSPGLTGPIDDAFTEPFVCVRGTGKPWQEATAKYAEAALQRFRAEWSKHWRGELPVKDDTDVDTEDVNGRHLILFGDPSSNSLLAQVVDALPLKWSKDTLTFAGKQYAAGEHVPVLIYPSPLNGERYVVLNTGHTFPTSAYTGTNALLYPRLGDYAVLRLTGGADPLATRVETAGLFDEYWRIPKGGK
jgi:pimeloyl-ACP methyl ester carboxylesterase